MKKRVRWNTDSIKEEFRKVHGDRYDYSKVDYKTKNTKVEIICRQHGSFEQRPNAHITLKQGCPKCSLTKQVRRMKDTTKSFVDKARQMHGDKYDYDKVKYGNTAHDKVIITCKVHGDFEQTPNSHLSGQGCRKCGLTNRAGRRTGWTKQSWKKFAGDKPIYLYLLRCYNTEKNFYKVGITSRDISDRFHGRSKMPYNYKVLKLIKSDVNTIYDLEKEWLKHLRDRRYKPKIKFGGSDRECFTHIH